MRRPYRINPDGKSRVLYGLLLCLAGYVCVLLASHAAADERAVLLRYWSLLAAGTFAVAGPHVLLPDPNLRLLQLLNLSPGALLAHQLRRWSGVPVLFLVTAAVLAFFDPAAPAEALAEKGGYWVESVLVMLGTGLYAFERYVTIGPVSQEWQEGTRGKAFRAMAEHSMSGRPAVPYGLVPALFATQRIFIVGVLVTVTAAYLEAFAAGRAAWVPGALVLGWAAVRLWGRLRTYDRYFYGTNAFYSEVFRSTGGVRASGREPIPYRAVYWVPRRWRPHTWASLLQLDRRLPLGRFILLGHGLLWLLFIQEADPGVITAYLLLFIGAKNAVVYLLATDPFAPPSFQATQQAPSAWAMTRFFVNVRWTLPLLLSLLLVALFEASFGYGDAVAWTGLDLAVALGAAWLVTYSSAYQDRRRYA